jgi:hypothetical protein
MAQPLQALEDVGLGCLAFLQKRLSSRKVSTV